MTLSEMAGTTGIARLMDRAVLALIGPRMERNDARIRRTVAGKTVLMTGASFGQGEATARLLAAHGAIVVMVARSAERLDEVAAEITAAGGIAHACPLDLSDMPAIDAFAKELLRTHGPIDILVHNAGKSLRRSIYRSAERISDMDAMVGANFTGPMRLTLALLPSMKANGGGQIVNIATAGLWMTPAAPRWGFYLGCKGGFDIWLRSVGLEAKRDGIDVTTVYAGHIKSRMVATGWVSKSPGHTPTQAARVLAYAITRRPRVMAPRGTSLTHVLGVAFEGPMSVVLSLSDRRSGESAASEAAFQRAMAKQRDAAAAAPESVV
ncbi:SDR family NAD(P)-dependent oxidoreductase [Rhodococcus sp. G-MC3]|uniref:SDR family NAD(P)-dependent oxidoreductase n=1 Tax=Rhodococcus sp. G-MC3 TaxID=3046209 RepID=UPI0024BB69E3|nr:SDR family NAD(P)-dependent oxidoreductase [Rhodococcus sp. G-MC3]MDJ0392455.1 SDR family NAD(P)-dependent oxidoreductase [Rhodococcus sp. G-MC3]